MVMGSRVPIRSPIGCSLSNSQSLKVIRGGCTESCLKAAQRIGYGSIGPGAEEVRGP